MSQRKIDVSTLSGWSSLADGTHSITLVAKASNYRDSVASQGVNVTKAPSGYSVKAIGYSEYNYGDRFDIYVDDELKFTLPYSTGSQNFNHDCGIGSEVYIDMAGGAAGCTYTMDGNSYSIGTSTSITLIGDLTVTSIYTACLTGDTNITLADGSLKRIDELTLNDKVLAYNEDGDLISDTITYTDSQENKSYAEYDIWVFENGYQVKTVKRHRFYNVERQAMVYMDEWKIGEHAITKDGEHVALLENRTIKETVKHYTLFTEHQNYFANGLLSGNRYTKNLGIV